MTHYEIQKALAALAGTTGITRGAMAFAYAWAMQLSPADKACSWEVANDAIVERWSTSGLIWIKASAHRSIEATREDFKRKAMIEEDPS